MDMARRALRFAERERKCAAKPKQSKLVTYHDGDWFCAKCHDQYPGDLIPAKHYDRNGFAICEKCSPKPKSK